MRRERQANWWHVLTHTYIHIHVQCTCVKCSATRLKSPIRTSLHVCRICMMMTRIHVVHVHVKYYMMTTLIFALTYTSSVLMSFDTLISEFPPQCHHILYYIITHHSGMTKTEMIMTYNLLSINISSTVQ